jgi:DNA-binding HxlR family transcriptional regulator
MSISDLIRLFHNRWGPPVLAELRRQRGSRFVTLSRMLGVGRDSLRRTLAALIDQGLVRRNPGYGHPLRPEYVLTKSGQAVARRCELLLTAVNGNAEIVLKKWSVPILAALARPCRFSELRARLPGVSTRALALALKDLERAGLVERRVDQSARPPAVVYGATRAAKALQQAFS